MKKKRKNYVLGKKNHTFLNKSLEWVHELKLHVYSLISIRQNYNFDMLANIWHEIVSWFLMISQDLRNMITKLFLFWFSYQCRTILWSQQTRTGKNRNLTNNAISNDGSSIEIIDRSHGDEAVHETVRNATSDDIIWAHSSSQYKGWRREVVIFWMKLMNEKISRMSTAGLV